VTNRDSSTTIGSTLHRPPPLMRIFRPPSRVRSSSSVSAPADAAKIAAMLPAAPAPMTTTRGMRLLVRRGRGLCVVGGQRLGSFHPSTLSMVFTATEW
jgi:hypothetical protein